MLLAFAGLDCAALPSDACAEFPNFLVCPTSCAAEYAEAGVVCGEDLGDLNVLKLVLFLSAVSFDDDGDGQPLPEYAYYYYDDGPPPQSCADASPLCQIDNPFGVAIRALCPETCNGAIICTDLGRAAAARAVEAVVVPEDLPPLRVREPPVDVGDRELVAGRQVAERRQRDRARGVDARGAVRGRKARRGYIPSGSFLRSTTP